MNQKITHQALDGYLLQQVTLPSLEFSAPDEMYVRCWNDEVGLRYNSQQLVFRRGGRVSFDTFFNGMTIDTWKEKCKINDLFLLIKGSGKFIIRFGLHRIGHSHKWLNEEVITINNRTNEHILEIKAWKILEKGILYFILEALDDGSISNACFFTKTEPINQVKLGIVITHFNRKNYVLPAIDRIKSKILFDSYYKNHIKLIVVDNSQNIAQDEARDIILLPNENLGGSGGFTRGLLYLKDDGSYTHCLFMDDDASCEIESICRTYALLQYTIQPKFAVAGSLLREIEPYRLFEKGANFDGICKPLKSGMDMRHVHDLLFAELTDKQPDYGGWWFYAFSLKDVENYAFPFFVRGDDIQFSLLNKFDINTMNGIACWGEDFSLKSGPLPIYLDVRNHLVQKLCILNSSAISSILLATRFFVAAVFSYNYATSKAVIKAVNDVAEGPQFWQNNLDTSRIRAEISSFLPNEKMQLIDRASYNVDYRSPFESKLRKIIRYMSLNGFLLPSFMLKDKVAFQHKGFRGNFREIFGYKKVLYGYEPLSIGYIAEHNKSAFFKNNLSFFKAIINFYINYHRIQNDYKNSLKSLTDESFWRKNLLK